MSMKTLVISTDMPDAVAQAVAVLAAGGLVAFPTDTVYGVGAHALLPDAVKRLFAAKVRPEGKAIPLLLGEAADLERVSCDVPALAWRLIAALWPGALTLVVPRGPLLPHIVTAGGPSVAVRLPDHALQRQSIGPGRSHYCRRSAGAARRPHRTAAGRRPLCGRRGLHRG